MATLTKGVKLLAKRSRSFLCHRQGYLPIAAFASHWNKDWKPGPIPHTPEERAAAAKKYGLRPEDYNCLSDSEVGDYPNLPLVCKHWRDPFEDYDMPGLKRNFGEPLHADYDIIGEDLWDPVRYEKYTYGQNFLYAVLTFFGFLGLYLLGSPYPFFLPQMPKQYPFNNLYLERGGDPELEEEVKHYTFEPAGED